MIVGEEKPDGGELKVGDTVQLAYVDQGRILDGSKTAYQEVSEGRDEITVGNREINARAYLSQFNFKGTDQQKKVGDLSGGERNRLHLAKLLKSGGNVLLLDEPTNDLDVDTLRGLEEALVDFAGCAVVISHDRWFLDRIATHILAFEGNSETVWFEGNFKEYDADLRRGLAKTQLPLARIRQMLMRRSIQILDSVDLILRQRAELLAARSGGNTSSVLVKKSVEQVHLPVRHVHDLSEPFGEVIVRGEKCHLVREVSPDRHFDTVIREFRVRRGVEEAVPRCRVIDNVNVVLRSDCPFHEGKETRRIALEHLLVPRDLAQHHRTHGEDEPGRGKAGRREYMVDEPAVDASVTIFEWMDVDEPECSGGGGGDRVHAACSSACVEGDQAAHQGVEVFRSRADMIRNGCLRVPIVFADEAAFRSQTEPDKPVVTDDLALKCLELLDREPGRSSFHDCLSPTA